MIELKTLVQVLEPLIAEKMATEGSEGLQYVLNIYDEIFRREGGAQGPLGRYFREKYNQPVHQAFERLTRKRIRYFVDTRGLIGDLIHPLSGAEILGSRMLQCALCGDQYTLRDGDTLASLLKGATQFSAVCSPESLGPNFNLNVRDIYLGVCCRQACQRTTCPHCGKSFTIKSTPEKFLTVLRLDTCDPPSQDSYDSIFSIQPPDTRKMRDTWKIKTGRER